MLGWCLAECTCLSQLMLRLDLGNCFSFLFLWFLLSEWLALGNFIICELQSHKRFLWNLFHVSFHLRHSSQLFLKLDTNGCSKLQVFESKTTCQIGPCMAFWIAFYIFFQDSNIFCLHHWKDSFIVVANFFVTASVCHIFLWSMWDKPALLLRKNMSHQELCRFLACASFCWILFHFHDLDSRHLCMHNFVTLAWSFKWTSILYQGMSAVHNVSCFWINYTSVQRVPNFWFNCKCVNHLRQVYELPVGEEVFVLLGISWFA